MGLHDVRGVCGAVPGRHRARRPHRGHAPLPGDDRVGVPQRAGRAVPEPGEQGQPVGAEPEATGWRGRRTCRLRGPGGHRHDLDPDHEYLFWVGCAGAFDDRAKKTTRAVAELMYMAAVGFAVLGTGGDLHRRPGPPRGQRVPVPDAGPGRPWRPSTTRSASGPRRKIVVTCPHCFNTLSQRVRRPRRALRGHPPHPAAEPAGPGPPAGGEEGPRPSGRKDVTYHDPCYLGRHNKVYSPPRELIEASGVTLKEMPRNSAAVAVLRRRWGADVDGGEDRQADQPGTHRRSRWPPAPRQIATGCPFCKVMLTDGLTARQNDAGHRHRPRHQRCRGRRRRPDAARRRQRRAVSSLTRTEPPGAGAAAFDLGLAAALEDRDPLQ